MWMYLCVLHSTKSHQGNWEGVTRGGRIQIHVRLHSTKSHQGNWELITEIHENNFNPTMLHSTKSHQGNWEHDFYCVKHNGIRKSCCIQRNPTKGIESRGRPRPGLCNIICLLQSTKSHQGNWEVMSTNLFLITTAFLCCIQRNPTKGIESHSYIIILISCRSCCIQRNPTKGIESHGNTNRLQIE